MPRKKADPDEQVLKLSKEHLFNKRMLDAEIKSIRTQLELVNVQINQLILSTPALKQLVDQKNSLGLDMNRRAADMAQLHKVIEETYGISLAECAFDDDTGRIQVLGKSPADSDDTPNTARSTPKRGRKKARS